MKTKYKIIIFLVIFILFAPILSITRVGAREIKEVKFELQKDIIANCGAGALACFDPNTQTIYLNYTQSGDLLILAIWHELGHFYIQDTTLEQLQGIYGEGNDHELREKAANKFQLFVQFHSVVQYIMKPAEIKFWGELIRK